MKTKPLDRINKINRIETKAFGPKQSCIILLILSLCQVRADITATVTPGYVFTEDEVVTAETLNLAAHPTVQVTGTLGGTNVALGAGTVSGTMLMDSVVDGINIGWNGSSPRGLTIPATSLGLGLYGGGGTKIHVRPDNATLTTNAAGELAIKSYANSLIGTGTNSAATNIFLGPYLSVTNTGTNFALIPTQFISTNITVINRGTNVAFPHGLGATPSFCRVVLICVTADNIGYLPGDEIPVEELSTSGTVFSHAIGWFCNSSNVVILRNDNPIFAMRKSDGQTYTTIATTNSYRLKIYARP